MLHKDWFYGFEALKWFSSNPVRPIIAVFRLNFEVRCTSNLN